MFSAGRIFNPTFQTTKSEYMQARSLEGHLATLSGAIAQCYGDQMLKVCYVFLTHYLEPIQISSYPGDRITVKDCWHTRVC